MAAWRRGGGGGGGLSRDRGGEVKSWRNLVGWTAGVRVRYGKAEGGSLAKIRDIVPSLSSVALSLSLSPRRSREVCSSTPEQQSKLAGS